MNPSTASRTALVTSLMRALHTRADPQRIIDDPWGDRLVPEGARKALAQHASGAPGVARDDDAMLGVATNQVLDAWLRGSVAYTTVITRSRCAEDALHAAVARGCTQYVIVGAGFDSYALRTPPAASHLTIYEVDHPATQSLKRRRMAECGIAAPDALHFLAADLSAESLGSVLKRSSFNPAQPAFFAWLGVSMYLTREANLDALRSIAACTIAGSELVFSYVDQFAFDNHLISSADIARSAASVGEPFLSGFHPKTLAHELGELGFALVEDLDDVQLLKRYDPHGLNRMRPNPFSRTARAQVSRVSGKGDAYRV